MVRHRVLIPAFVLVAMLVGVAPAAALHWEAKVVRVKDGDTILADVPNDGKNALPVRFAGLDTMELGLCHAAAAKALTQRILGARVELTARHSRPLASLGRYLRYVDTARDTSYTWNRDVGAILLSKGLATPYPSNVEPTRNLKYKRIALEAQRRGVGIWDHGPVMANGEPSGSDACGAGPYQLTPIKLTVRWDADGNDDRNKNDEWVRIDNDGDTPLPMNGWTLRDASHRHFHFSEKAPGTVIQPHSWIKVHSGSGQNSEHHLHWGSSRSVFDNAIFRSGRVAGDGAYLTDRDNDVRAFVEYLCITACVDPVGRSIDLSANWDGAGNDDEHPNNEWVNVRNIGGAPVSLTGHTVSIWPYTYEFDQRTVIDPGQRLRLYIGRGSDSTLARYWGRAAYYGRGTRGINEGSVMGADDKVVLGTYTGPTAKRLALNGCPAISQTIVRQACPKPDVVISSVDASGDAFVVRNNTGHKVDLVDWMAFGSGLAYDFRTSRVLGSGQRLRVAAGSKIPNDGGVLRLLTPYRDTASCRAWGRRRC